MTRPHEVQSASIEAEILAYFADRNFERSRRFSDGAYDPQRLRDFLQTLGNPQWRYTTLHVAGTVGKGSTTTYLARALTQMGYRTGAYFSPHLISLTERFTIDGARICADELREIWHELRSHAALPTLSFFDAMTALAFIYFARAYCDMAVIETGLGGRLDSTNNLKARAAILTLVDLDHQNVLGDTLEKIALEKAGIIQEGQRVYSMPQARAVENVFIAECKRQRAELIGIDLPEGNYLDQNRAFAAGVIEREFSPSREQVRRIAEALDEPIFARLSLVRDTPRVFFDGGHNAAAMRALCVFINAQAEETCHIFLNTMQERDLATFSAILKNGIHKKLQLYFLPVQDALYYGDAPDASGLQRIDAGEIRRLIGLPQRLNLFTGSMGIYKELLRILEP